MGRGELAQVSASVSHAPTRRVASVAPSNRSVTFDGASIGSEHLPAHTAGQDSRDQGDCRTRSYVQTALQKAAAARSRSVATDSGHVGSTAARIFEHSRGTSIEDPLSRHTITRTPASWAEIESWLGNLVATASTVSPDSVNETISSIKIVFLNEKRCHRAFPNEVCDSTTLHPYLKVADWSTSHYMTTFCRFPVPLNVEEDLTPGAYNWEYRYSVSHPFDWDMLWAYLPQTRTTVGIVRTWFDDYDANFQDMERMVETFAGPTLAHPTLLGLLALQILTSDAMANVREKGNRLFEAQKLTGFHTYSHLRSTDANIMDGEDGSGNLGTVTREILAAASNLTGWDNAAVALANFARFLMEENNRFATSFALGHDRQVLRLCRYMNEQALKQISDLDGAKKDCLAWLATATFLLQGVLNLVSQQDAHLNISLAKSSNEIAMDAKRDSNSMMAIAVVTMFFLPGTFTSSFFALPFWDDVTPGPTWFWVYWAVTVPLTIMTLVAYRIWVWFTKKRAKKALDAVNGYFPKEPAGP